MKYVKTFESFSAEFYMINEEEEILNWLKKAGEAIMNLPKTVGKWWANYKEEQKQKAAAAIKTAVEKNPNLKAEVEKYYASPEFKKDQQNPEINAENMKKADEMAVQSAENASFKYRVNEGLAAETVKKFLAGLGISAMGVGIIMGFFVAGSVLSAGVLPVIVGLVLSGAVLTGASMNS